MTLDSKRVQQYLKDFDFKTLFTQELGWDHHSAELQVTVDGQTFILTAVVHKHGLAVFVCPPDSDGTIPPYSIRCKIEQQVTKSSHEHIIIYSDSRQTSQIWQWVKREAGKPTRRREHSYHRGQPGDSLIQKLNAIAVSLAEEEQVDLIGIVTRVRGAFDVERVTKKFYDRFKTEHAAFLKFLDGIPDEEMERWYASVMLNRLMFIYFIQKKGFLDNDPDYLRNKLAQSKVRGKDRFYSGFLCPLFFQGFAKKEDERSEGMNKLLGKVPYLNGGIFQKHQIEELHDKTIAVCDAAFEKIFAFFEDYQWHLDERPLRNGKEINPDVLGHIFEKYINQKQMGAYYTKEDITEYISKNTIIPYLFDAARKECKIAFEEDHSIWQLLQTDPDRYIYDAVKHGLTVNIHEKPSKALGKPSPLPPEIAAGSNDASKRTHWNKSAPPEYALPTEIWREIIARRKRYEEVRAKLANGEIHDINDLITYNLNIRQFARDVIENCEGPETLRAFWHSIEKITVLDPTCGSGAFLFAALNILDDLYEACLDRMEVFLEELDQSGKKHRPEKYSDFRKVLERIELHPNRRYFVLKSIIVNNLYGVDIMEEAVEICKLRLFLKLVAQIENTEQIEPLPDIDFNIRAGNTLVGFTSLDTVRDSMSITEGGQRRMLYAEEEAALARIEQKGQDVDRLFALFRKQQTEVGGDITPADKQELRKRLRTLEDELNRYLASEYGIDLRKKDSYGAWLKSHHPFHWFVEFHGIIKQGGFDVIIGNPPYVEYHTIKSCYEIKSYSTEACGNLYAYVIERCFTLSCKEARVGMIVQLSAICTDRMEPLQQEYLARTRILWSSCYDDRPGKLFEGLEHIRATILLSLAGSSHGAEILTTNLVRWSSGARGQLFSLIWYGSVNAIKLPGSFPKGGDHKLKTVLNKVRSLPHRLESSHNPSSQTVVYYYRSPLYWIRAMDFLPFFSSHSARRSIHHFKDFRVSEPLWAPIVGCIINSTLFYIWFIAYGNGRNVAIRDIITFPIPVSLMDSQICPGFNRLFANLMADFKEKSVIRKRRDGVEYQEFYPGKSKPIIDEIDRVLAQHYGFTDEELDFIINYDIKYRMGAEAEETD